MAAPLEYLLNTLKVGALEKVSFSNTENPQTVITVITYDKHYLLNRDNLAQQIQMKSSKKKKTFSEFFLHF